MTYEDWVRIINFAGSVVLFYASYRGIQWSKRQATLEERAASHGLVTPAHAPTAPDSAKSDNQAGQSDSNQAAFDQAAADMASRPYFDRRAYIIFCIGFAMTTVASAIDICGHGTLGKLMGERSTSVSEARPAHK